VFGLMLWNGEATISQGELQLWRDRYRILFDRNVAGTILTNVEGCIVDLEIEIPGAVREHVSAGLKAKDLRKG